ncbi:kinase-like domain-containing protein [Suillus subaureus]|uniref:Kinase-like domain-containing protein n=1 Tax=Suillus subaureus TaxID=48587 RepID=A0A9P7E6D7_9AGAM|nr:kinase-like domain-containing protein [Suillus subaureus]KAG1812476.1 kinase-like domain-containing protein [Suillus subaureus]
MTQSLDLLFCSDTLSDFRFQISALEFGNPCTSGSFGTVYRGTINTNEEVYWTNLSDCINNPSNIHQVAVKVFKIDSGRAVEKYEKAMRRELKVWLRLSKHPTIVPLLGIAHAGLPLPVLISQWMPSGTLYTYLEQPINTITASNKVELVRGVADGLGYLHSENVVHGDLHPANVLVDGVGNPRLTDFGLATVVGDAELQLGMTTVTREFDVRWRAPEVIGVDPKDEPVRPNFKSDIYSFGGVMFFIVSGDIPWKEKKQPHIIIELSKRATPARPDNIFYDHWNLIQKCWSWNPDDRPEATEITCSDIHDDFTSQISALKLGNPCKSGSFATVYQFTIETSEGTKEVAVKVFKTDSGRAVEKYVRAMRRELNVWIRVSKHQNIVPLLGTADVESPCPALVSQWMPSGTLDTYLEKHGTITTLAKAHLVRGVADGLGYRS